MSGTSSVLSGVGCTLTTWEHQLASSLDTWDGMEFGETQKCMQKMKAGSFARRVSEATLRYVVVSLRCYTRRRAGIYGSLLLNY
jgi:hypothetical protein